MCWRCLDGDFSKAKVQLSPILGCSTECNQGFMWSHRNLLFKTAIWDVQ